MLFVLSVCGRMEIIMRTQKTTISALLLALLFLLTGCAGSEAQAPSSGDAAVTLTVVTSYGGDDGSRSSFEKAVADYQESTGIQVQDVSSSSSEEWKAKVLTDFMTGSEPDVLFYFTDADADPFINAGKVVSIEEIRAAYPDYATNMKQSMMAVASDGLHYAVPSYGFWENLFVNKAVLKECGIKVPGPNYTWDQFLHDCQTIKSHGYTPIACSLNEIPHYWFEFAVLNNGNISNHMEVPRVDGDGNLIDDAVSQRWIAALDDITSLYQAGFFPSNTLTASDAQTTALFAEGRAAFLIDGSWKVGFFSKNYPDQLENFAISYVPGKGQRPASDAIGGISMGYFITRKAWEDPEKREAAVEFVFHMTSEQVLSTFITTEATALVTGATPAGLNSLQQSAADANTNITGFASAVQDTISGEAKSELFASIPKVVTGQMSAADAVEAAMRLN